MHVHKTYEVKNESRSGEIGLYIAAWGLFGIFIDGILIWLHVLSSDNIFMTISILVLALGWGLRWKQL